MKMSRQNWINFLSQGSLHHMENLFCWSVLLEDLSYWKICPTYPRNYGFCVCVRVEASHLCFTLILFFLLIKKITWYKNRQDPDKWVNGNHGTTIKQRATKCNCLIDLWHKGFKKFSAISKHDLPLFWRLEINYVKCGKIWTT